MNKRQTHWSIVLQTTKQKKINELVVRNQAKRITKYELNKRENYHQPLRKLRQVRPNLTNTGVIDAQKPIPSIQVENEDPGNPNLRDPAPSPTTHGLALILTQVLDKTNKQDKTPPNYNRKRLNPTAATRMSGPGG